MTGAKAILGAAVFGAVIAVIYWFAVYEPVGVVLLGGMTLAMCWMAAYIALKMRGAPPPVVDLPDAVPGDLAGRRVGVFTAWTGWPILLALGIVLLVIGLAYALWIAVAGFIIGFIATVGLIVQSRT